MQTLFYCSSYLIEVGSARVKMTAAARIYFTLFTHVDGFIFLICCSQWWYKFNVLCVRSLYLSYFLFLCGWETYQLCTSPCRLLSPRWLYFYFVKLQLLCYSASLSLLLPIFMWVYQAQLVPVYHIAAVELFLLCKLKDVVWYSSTFYRIIWPMSVSGYKNRACTTSVFTEPEFIKATKPGFLERITHIA